MSDQSNGGNRFQRPEGLRERRTEGERCEESDGRR